MEKSKNQRSGKWKVRSNYIAGVGKRYFVARLINVDEPEHAGNLEQYGEYTEDIAGAEYIADALNRADEAKRNAEQKTASEVTNAEANEASGEPKKNDEKKKHGSKGYRLLITDIATGEVTNDAIIGCLIGSYSKFEKNDTVAGRNLIIMSCTPLAAMDTIMKCEETIERAKKSFFNEMGIDKFLDTMLGKIFNKSEKGTTND